MYDSTSNLKKQPEYDYKWNKNTNKFYDSPSPPLNLTPGSGNLRFLFKTIIKEIEKRSGIKARSCWVTAVLLLLVSFLGYGLGYFLIRTNHRQSGGMVLVFTPIISYFLIVGFDLTRGSQVSRLDDWMKKNQTRLNNSLGRFGFRVFHSFNKSEFYLEKNQEATMKDKLVLCCCKHFVEGSIKFVTVSDANISTDEPLEEGQFEYFDDKTKREFEIKTSNQNLDFNSQIHRFQSYLSNTKSKSKRSPGGPGVKTKKFGRPTVAKKRAVGANNYKFSNHKEQPKYHPFEHPLSSPVYGEVSGGGGSQSTYNKKLTPFDTPFDTQQQSSPNPRFLKKNKN